MGKVFTITEGLENLGAMKTGGQGSVYKGRRIGEIITAVKLLPTPIYSESADDRNFVAFQNEVQKLKKVNEISNPNIVKILSSGVSDTGNFPFIEMEFIEGPDLEDLLKPPHPPVFTIKEILKVAEQLSHALAHCHKAGVKHGDIKSNNVKFNIHSGNYVLLDFGLAVMSDEQRRSSLRHAGAIEFMAPEQNEGQMLFETDVYSFGIIIYELLAGRVPFPLNEKGETARNAVRLAHIETEPPNVLSLRKNALPSEWSAGKKEHEMHVPDWLVAMVEKCLQKNPADRFADAISLHDYIITNSPHPDQDENNREALDALELENNKLLAEKERLRNMLADYKQELAVKDHQLNDLKGIWQNKSNQAKSFTAAPVAQQPVVKRKGVSKVAFLMLLIVAVALAASVAVAYINNSVSPTKSLEASASEEAGVSSTKPATSKALTKRKSTVKSSTPNKKVEAVNNRTSLKVSEKPTATLNKQKQPPSIEKRKDQEPRNDANNYAPLGKYKVASVAYFYNEPDESTRRNAFINHWNNAILRPTIQRNGFIYIVYKNDHGQVSKGWLRKRDLIPVFE